MDRARSRLTPHLLGDGRAPGGLADLRARVAERWTLSGLQTSVEQVLVTNGAMGALHALLEQRSGSVLIEDPSYHNAVRMLGRQRRRTVSWPRHQAWDTVRLGALLRTERPALAYLVPDFHNPTGVLATDEECAGVAAIARRHPGTTFVIDETLRALVLERSLGRSLPAHAGEHIAAAITVGGLSKTMWSGLRVGWMRLPNTRDVAMTTQFSDVQPVPILDQLVAIELWPYIDDVVAGRVERLREHRDRLVSRCQAAGLQVASPPGGLACWIDLGQPVASRLVDEVALSGIVLAPGPMFGTAARHEHFVRLPFTHEPVVTDSAVDQIVEVLAGLNRPRRRNGRGGSAAVPRSIHSR